MKPFQKVAVHALIKKGNKYLVTKRSLSNDYKPGVWDIPGGTVEIGETPEEALIRETIEETSFTVEIVNPIFVCSDFRSKVRHQFWIVYECNYIDGEVRLDDEHDEFLWATKKEIQRLDKIYFLDKFYKEKLS